MQSEPRQFFAAIVAPGPPPGGEYTIVAAPGVGKRLVIHSCISISTADVSPLRVAVLQEAGAAGAAGRSVGTVSLYRESGQAQCLPPGTRFVLSENMAFVAWIAVAGDMFAWGQYSIEDVA